MKPGSLLAALIMLALSLAQAAGVNAEPVVFHGDTLLTIRAGLGPFTPAQRAAGVKERLETISRRLKIARDTFWLVEDKGTADIHIDDLLVMSVTAADTAGTGLSAAELARHHAGAMTAAITKARGFSALREAATGLALSLVALAAMAGALLATAWLFPKLITLIRGKVGENFKGLRIGRTMILSPGAAMVILTTLTQSLRLMMTVALPYFSIVFVLGALPWTRGWNAMPVLNSLVLALILSIAALALARVVNYLHRYLSRRLGAWKDGLIQPLRVKKMEILSSGQILGAVLFIARAVRVTLLLALAYIYLTVMFSLFPFSRTWAASLWGYVFNPLKGAALALVAYIPKAFFIAVVCAITYYLLKLAKTVFRGIGRGTISIPNFHRDWAMPTYSIARFLIIVFAVIIVFPYLPGSDSPFFKGISVFLGVLLSLGSSSAVSNVVAGVVLTYMRPFVVGDRVKVGETAGDVVDKTLLVTTVRTIKNEDITIPNSMVLGAHIVNYSREAEERGLILHTTVTIGYDAPWRKVHELLLEAAGSTEGVLKAPKPFVLQTSLDDFFVSYELNCHTDRPTEMARIYSELHQNIQDQFNKAGVEIMSPHYRAVRSGSKAKISG